MSGLSPLGGQARSAVGVDTTPLERPAAPSFREAFLFWLKLGFISFGGPAGQIAVMHQELVERRRWISERRFLHALNYCMVLPGPEAQQLATYIGWLMHRTWGGIVAGALFVLPSLFILIALSWIYMAFGDTPLVAGLFYGIKPAVTAIVLHAAHRIGSRALKNGALWAVAAAAFLAIFVLNVPFPFIVLGAGVIGALGGRFAPQRFAMGGGHGAAKDGFGPAVIDDDTPPPPHATHRWSRLARVATIGLLLWAGAMGALLATVGWNGALTQMGWFFTKAALLTFGGAYAVLPYVVDAAVEHGWASAAQMIDGLALGESTPGPLIMIVAFVGFVGAWAKQLFGPEALFLAGVLGASVATFFTFLPSFLFILAGAPFIESTRGDVKLTAPLTAIAAAVVGVIANLTVFFAWRVFWPESTSAAPFAGRFDLASVLIAAVAASGLLSKRVEVIPVILASGLAGLALWAAGLQGAT